MQFIICSLVAIIAAVYYEIATARQIQGENIKTLKKKGVIE